LLGRGCLLWWQPGQPTAPGARGDRAGKSVQQLRAGICTRKWVCVDVAHNGSQLDICAAALGSAGKGACGCIKAARAVTCGDAVARCSLGKQQVCASYRPHKYLRERPWLAWLPPAGPLLR
jgi:hypothetical protein